METVHAELLLVGVVGIGIIIDLIIMRRAQDKMLKEIAQQAVFLKTLGYNPR